MILWVIVIVVLSFLAFLWIKLEHQARVIKFVVLIIILLLLASSMLVLFNSGSVDLSSPGGVVSGVYLYIGWLGDFVVDLWHIGSDATGKVINSMNSADSKVSKK